MINLGCQLDWLWNQLRGMSLGWCGGWLQERLRRPSLEWAASSCDSPNVKRRNSAACRVHLYWWVCYLITAAATAPLTDVRIWLLRQTEDQQLSGVLQVFSTRWGLPKLLDSWTEHLMGSHLSDVQMAIVGRPSHCYVRISNKSPSRIYINSISFF